MEDLIQRFQQVFVGGEQAHGEWSAESGAITHRKPAAPDDYRDHLQGKRGLGLVPIRQDGTCRFAAIDIDVDTINHQQLFETVTNRKMPLTVCRSKSGGAHLYLFTTDPGLPAAQVIQTLKKWSALLGHPKAEIFPKQAKVDKKNLGNWINLPYFDWERTTRYAVGPKGALGLEEFLTNVLVWDGKTQPDEQVTRVTDPHMPPCLVVLQNDGPIPEGYRNQALFNIAVFYRKSSPNNWEERTTRFNLEGIRPPLSNREAQSIIRSVNQRKYQYTCEQEPLCSRCDRRTCLTLPYGVGHMPWQEAGSYDELLVGHCRKILTDPPRYIIEVNGHDVAFSSSQVRKYPLFCDRVMEELDLILAPMKQERWLQTVRELLATKKDIEAPKDASPQGLIIGKVHEFLSLHERARNRDDLLKGIPYEYEGYILFRFSDLLAYLQRQRVDTMEQNQIYQILHLEGCGWMSIRLKGKVTTVWKFPASQLNKQREDFDKEEQLADADEI